MEVMEAAVSIENAGFRYNGADAPAFQQLNLIINKGDRFGLFGPNGAGKTTLMHCMTGLFHCQQGTIKLLGNKVEKNNKNINHLFGLVPQDFSFYHELTPVENLAFFGAWSGLKKDAIKKRTEELLEVLDLTEIHNKPVHKFSGGMKRKVNLAIGVIHNPQVLFLDEPTVGVDIQTRNAIISYLKQLNENGTTLIYTSHQLNEAEELCNTIAMIDQGKIIARDTLAALLAAHEQDGLEGLFMTLTGKKFRDADV